MKCIDCPLYENGDGKITDLGFCHDEGVLQYMVFGNQECIKESIKKKVKMECVMPCKNLTENKVYDVIKRTLFVYVVNDIGEVERYSRSRFRAVFD